MTIHHLIITITALLTLSACERKHSTTEEIKDSVNDALDRRPGEKILDAAEDTKDAVNDAAHDVKKSIKKATN